LARPSPKRRLRCRSRQFFRLRLAALLREARYLAVRGPRVSFAMGTDHDPKQPERIPGMSSSPHFVGNTTEQPVAVIAPRAGDHWPRDSLIETNPNVAVITLWLTFAGGSGRESGGFSAMDCSADRSLSVPENPSAQRLNAQRSRPPLHMDLWDIGRRQTG